MNLRQLRVVALSLSMPGMIVLSGAIHIYITNHEILDQKISAMLVGTFLLGYIAAIIRVLMHKNHNDDK